MTQNQLSVRTGRTDRPLLAVRSEINGGDASGGFLLQGIQRRGGRSANSGGARRRRDRLKHLGRHLAKRDEGVFANLRERSAWSGDHRRRGWRRGIPWRELAGLGEEGGSRGIFRRGSGRGASRGYGECFAQINSA